MVLTQVFGGLSSYFHLDFFDLTSIIRMNMFLFSAAALQTSTILVPVFLFHPTYRNA